MTLAVGDVQTAVRSGYRLGRLWLALPDRCSHPACHARSDDRAEQYAWQISTMTFRQGQTVDFAVTSRDVNHGFGLYSPDGKLVA